MTVDEICDLMSGHIIPPQIKLYILVTDVFYHLARQ